MRVLKWTPDFSVEEEPSIVPVWISIPNLPVYYYEPSYLYSIGGLIGKPLKMDAATQSLSRPSVARICVEVDLLKELPQRIRLGKKEKGFWRDVVYENLPSYCDNCCKLGHARHQCRLGAPKQKPQQEQGDLRRTLDKKH